jgi:calcineurin-like phosphoesterase family protein
MLDVFYIADTHFGHKNIVRFQRPDGSLIRPWTDLEQMHEDLIANWNRKVTPKDTVYILGDVVWSAKYFPVLKRLNGNKILIAGNHDTIVKDHIQCYNSVYTSRVHENLFLTHIPVHCSSIPARCTHNIHGHLHDRRVLLEDKSVDPRYFCVSVEHIGYAPIEHSELLIAIKNQ